MNNDMNLSGQRGNLKKVLIPCFALLLMACGQSKTPDSSASTEPDTTKAVVASAVDTTKQDTAKVDAVTSATAMPNHSSFNGILMVPPQRYATVTLTMGGTVHSVRVLSGSYVRRGTLLVTLENPEFVSLQQNYLEAHAQAEYLEAEYRRQQRLSTEEAASQKRFQQSKADYLSMKSRLEAAAAQLTLLGVAPQCLLNGGIRTYLEVKAPLDGYVAALDVNLGKYVTAGQPLCEVINKGETLLRMTAYEKDLKDLSAGRRVQFRVNGMGAQTFHATLVSVGQEVDKTNRSIEVYARVKESNPRFRPGMYISARVEK